jgi:hypothetical protein
MKPVATGVEPGAEHGAGHAADGPLVALDQANQANVDVGAAAELLQALQQRGAAQADPVAWAHLQALASRSAVHRGATRRWLETRLAGAAAALDQRLQGGPDTPSSPPGQVVLAKAPVAPAGPLAGLVALLNGVPATWADGPAAGPGALPAPPARAPATAAPSTAAPAVAAAAQLRPGGMPSAGVTDPLQPAAPSEPSPLQPAGLPALKSLQRFKGTWARLSAEQRLARSQAQVPQGSGPLNSQWLVQRALQRLQALSPAYLQHFVAHADALLWLQQAADPAPVAGQVLRSDGEASAVKRKPRPKAKAAPKVAQAGAAEPGHAGDSATAAEQAVSVEPDEPGQAREQGPGGD